MRKVKIALLSLLSISMLVIGTQDLMAAQDRKDRKKKKTETEAVVKPKTPEEKEKEKYDKLIKGAKTSDGMFKTHLTPAGKLYFEINPNIEERVMLISNRMATTTDTRDFVAGQMITTPFMVRMSVDTARVVLYAINERYIIDDNDPIKLSYDKNLSDPIIKTFKPVAKNGENVVIDVTAFFSTNEKSISPLKPANPLAALFGGRSPIKGSFSKDDSYITGVKSFPENVEIKSIMNFTRDASQPNYTVNVHRSIVLLPKEPMQVRYQDNRVGYFSNYYTEFSSELDGTRDVQYINRWRLEPKEEDMAKYFAGELVEPKKPIIFYVDPAFPEKWRATVLQGIEDWKIAFEAAGFKNAIQGRMYPTKEEDPNFDPDDMRYSCIKYATTKIANAMGPSYVDPRSGEILVGDVIWYHDVVSLVHNWRFVQTAAVDPSVRKTVFDNETMNESLRYVTSHEIGHTLGLMHNMGASYSYPVDSLRSATFTQEYGTTPSIMDYARNNYVAQPGDLEKGVRMTPPIIGVYDVHAINWGYRLFKNTTPESEKKNLNAILAEKEGDDMYRFGAQQIFGNVDYTDLTEDLGDDHVKASDYCISNLKIILDNLEEWHKEDGTPYSELVKVYNQVLQQYVRVALHVATDIGGMEHKVVLQGEPAANKAIEFPTKAFQKRSMLWMLNQARTCTDWLTPQYVIDRFPSDEILPNVNDKLPMAFTSLLFSHTAIGRMYVNSTRLGNKDGYTVEGYYDDLVNEIFKETVKGRNLDAVEMDMQSVALDQLINLSGIIHPSEVNKGGKSLAEESEIFINNYAKEIAKSSIACSRAHVPETHVHSADCDHSHTSSCDHSHSVDNSFARINMNQTIAPQVLTKPIAFSKIKWIKSQYQRRLANANRATKAFYELQLAKIDVLLSEGVVFRK